MDALREQQRVYDLEWEAGVLEIVGDMENGWKTTKFEKTAAETSTLKG